MDDRVLRHVRSYAALASDTFGGIIEGDTLSNTAIAPRCRALDYSSAALDMSDHKPVRAVLELQVRHIIRAERRAVLSQVTRRLDQWENEMQPTAELECSSLSFDDVRFGADCAQTRAMRIRNTGEVRLVYRLIAKPREERASKPWLTVKPTYGIAPGETSELRATVCVSGSVANALATEDPQLSDILTRLEGGRDFYVTISANYLRSAFGVPLEIAMNEHAARSIVSRRQAHAGDEQKAGDNTTQPLYVPKELWRCVDFLCVNAAPAAAAVAASASPLLAAGSPPARRGSSRFPRAVVSCPTVSPLRCHRLAA